MSTAPNCVQHINNNSTARVRLADTGACTRQLHNTPASTHQHTPHTHGEGQEQCASMRLALCTTRRTFQEGLRDPHTSSTDVGRNLTRHHSRAATAQPGEQLSTQDSQLLAAADAAQLLATTTAHLRSCWCRTRDSRGSTSVKDASAHTSRQHTKCIIAKHLTSTAGLGLPSCAAGAAVVPLVRLSSCSLRPVFSAITVCSRARRLLLSASICDRRASISTICSFLRSRDLRGVRQCVEGGMQAGKTTSAHVLRQCISHWVCQCCGGTAGPALCCSS